MRDQGSTGSSQRHFPFPGGGWGRCARPPFTGTPSRRPATDAHRPGRVAPVSEPPGCSQANRQSGRAGWSQSPGRGYEGQSCRGRTGVASGAWTWQVEFQADGRLASPSLRGCAAGGDPVRGPGWRGIGAAPQPGIWPSSWSGPAGGVVVKLRPLDTTKGLPGRPGSGSAPGSPRTAAFGDARRPGVRAAAACRQDVTGTRAGAPGYADFHAFRRATWEGGLVRSPWRRAARQPGWDLRADHSRCPRAREPASPIPGPRVRGRRWVVTPEAPVVVCCGGSRRWTVFLASDPGKAGGAAVAVGGPHGLALAAVTPKAARLGSRSDPRVDRRRAGGVRACRGRTPTPLVVDTPAHHYPTGVR